MRAEHMSRQNSFTERNGIAQPEHGTVGQAWATPTIDKVAHTAIVVVFRILKIKIPFSNIRLGLPP